MKHQAHILVLSLSAFACSPSPASEQVPAQQPSPVEPSPKSDAAVTLVDDPSLICMINNQFMGVPQIPVVVEGTTYYGCCEMCKTRLANEPDARVAIDPVTERPIDKAVAVLGKTPSGAILYFESQANLEAYRPAPE